MAVRAFFIVATLAAAMVASANAALDLTATPEEYVSSGIVYRRLVFKDDKRRVEMEFPRGWNFRVVSSARLELSPPGNGFAAAVIQTQSAEASVFDEAAVKTLAQEALAALPVGSQAATVEQTRAEPDGKESEMTLSYKNLGYTFRRSIKFVNRPECRLMVQISAPEAEFPALNATFRRLVQSLSWN
jgi:hypothetical protein